MDYKAYDMDIQTEKLRLIELLLQTNNPSIIERIKSIFQTERTQDLWEEITNEQKKEIENSLEEVQNGQIVLFDQFLEKQR